MQKLPVTPHISTVAASASRITLYIFAAALIGQTFHMIEHAAQVYQHAILGLSISESHGILFFLDLEWNHLIFNALYVGLLAVVFFQCRFYQTSGAVSERRLACLAFNAGFLVQGYHTIEHSVRMIQLFQVGCTPCPGILGRFFDGVYLHAVFNSLVYLLPLIAFFAYGFHSKFFGEKSTSEGVKDGTKVPSIGWQKISIKDAICANLVS